MLRRDTPLISRYPRLAEVARRMGLTRVPLFFPLLMLTAILLGQGQHGLYYLLALPSLIYCLLWSRGALLILCLLVGAIGYVQMQQRQEYLWQAHQQLSRADEMTLRGTLVRVTAYSAFLELEGLAPVKVELRCRQPDTFGRLGDRVEIEAIPYEGRSSNLPGRFDRQAWLERESVAQSVQLLSLRHLDRPLSWAWLRGEAALWREQLITRLIPSEKSDDARRQVLAALVLGEKQQAEHATLELFQWSGGLHAFAVSGLHVGLVAGLLWLILRLLRVPPRTATLTVLIVTAGYVWLTGMAVSSVRAYLMMSLFLTGFLLRRQVSALNLLCAAALLTLLISPMQLQHAGFLLSFLVYAAILMASKLMEHGAAWFGPDEYLPRVFYTRGERMAASCERMLRGTLLISGAAWLASLPLMMLLFGTWNALGILTNTLITPLLPLVMGCGLLLLLLAPLPWLGALIDTIAVESAGLLLAVVSWSASLPGSYLPTAPPALAQEYLIMDLGFGKSACLLGNGGILLAEGNEQDTRWRTRPAIFASGFYPSLLLQLPNSTASQQRESSASLLTLRALWRELDAVSLRSMSQPQPLEGLQPRIYHHPKHPQLRWTVYPAPIHSAERASQADYTPLILWQAGEQRLLYVGDASAASFAYWQQQRGADLRAETVILGYNEKQPLLDEQWLQTIRTRKVILLPSFPREMQGIFSSSLRYHRVDKASAIRGMLGA